MTTGDIRRCEEESNHRAVPGVGRCKCGFRKYAPPEGDAIQGEVVAPEFRLERDPGGNYWRTLDGNVYRPLGAEEERAREIVRRLNAAHRPNLEMRVEDLWVCWNEHDHSAGCQWELLVKDAYNLGAVPPSRLPVVKELREEMIPRAVPAPSRFKLERRMQQQGVVMKWACYAEDGRLRLFKPDTYLSEETAGYNDPRVTVRVLVTFRGKRPYLAILPVSRAALDNPRTIEELAWMAYRMAEEG